MVTAWQVETLAFCPLSSLKVLVNSLEDSLFLQMFFSSLNCEESWQPVLRLFLERDHGYFLADAKGLVLAFVSAVTGCYWSCVGSLAHPLEKDHSISFHLFRVSSLWQCGIILSPTELCCPNFISILGLTWPMDCKLDIPAAVCLLKMTKSPLWTIKCPTFF